MLLFVSYGYKLHNCPIQLVDLVTRERFFPLLFCVHVRKGLVGRRGEGIAFISISLTFTSVIVINVRLFLLVLLANSGFRDGGEVLSCLAH